MKPQDLLFILVLIFLVYKRNPNWATYAGLTALGIAIPLYWQQVFFTASRSVVYAAAFFLLAVIMQCFQFRKHGRIKK